MKNVRHTGVVVADMERAVQFYRDLLGMTVAIDFAERGEYIETIAARKGVHVRMVKLTAPGGGMVELLQYLSPKSPQGRGELWRLGPTHLAFTVENVDELYEALKHSGVPFNCPPVVSPDGKAKLTFCLDPDGTYIELVQMLNP